MFLISRRAAAGDDRSPWGDFWFEPVSIRSGSGLRVSADSALRTSAVFACVRVLAETFASMPFCLYRRMKDGSTMEVRDHWLYSLFARRPNRWQNPFEWREMLQGHLALRGNAFNRIYANARGEIAELVPIHPDRISIEMLDNGSYRYRIRERDGSETVLPRTEIWHLRGLSSDGLMGLSPIDLARESIGVALAAQDYGARFFMNDARPGSGWIEFPGSFKDTAARQTFRETWQAAQGGANRGKVAVLEHGMKYHELGLNNEQAQFLETRQFQIPDIARWFRIPPHLIGDLSRATFANIEHQSLEFATYTMAPWGERWEAAIEAELLSEEDGLEVEFDMTALMRGDSKSRADYYSRGILDGWMTRNEARMAEHLNPIDGLDEPLVPLNMSVVGEEPAEPLEPTPRAPGPDDEGGAGEARLAVLAEAAAERIVRREVEVVKRASSNGFAAVRDAYARHAAFVAEVLSLPNQEATRYCEAQLAAFVAGEGALEERLSAAGLPRLRALAMKGTT